MDALPAWATVVAPPAEPSPWAPAAGFEGSVTLDGGESLPVDGGTLERSDDPELLVTLQFGKNGSTLALWISGWAGGAGDPVGGGELVLRPDDAPAEVFLGGPCPVQIGDDGGSGSFACTFTLLADEAEAQTIDVEATWATDALPEPSIETGDTVVSWHLGGGIVSQGEAIVEGRPGPAGAASVFIVPDVPLEATELGAVLRLRIVGFSGDGSYSGAAVDPAIDILTSSPLLAVPVDEPEGQPWGPILGACTATVTDGGASGTMSCPGDPSFQVDPRFGGSVTLVASWRAAT